MDPRSANRRIRDALAQLEREVATGRAPDTDYDIAIRRDGTWTYRGSPIARPAIVKLFASVLHRTTDGRHWLVTPVERTVVHVEDAAFVGVELHSEGAGMSRRLAVRTNLDAWLAINDTHPLRMTDQPDGSAVPYMETDEGLDIRLARPVFYELADLAEPDGTGRIGIWSDGTFFPIGMADDEAHP